MTERQLSSQEEPLNESWVELHFQNNGLEQSESLNSIHNGNMEHLLREAQLESSRSSSRVTSNASSKRGSPKGTQGPPSPNHTASDWIWDWSSRPELQPPADWGSKFKHPGQQLKPRRHKLSVRNTSVMRSSLFNLENLPTLLLTHACTFFLGAATMLIYLKRYCNWAAATAISLD
ncbi:BCL2/adenovirus E1B 19 kDa protein-interacting protein 3-like [Tubulanus polymorphus]|uniref:BCL2/adenovirus E1B 19 kDa protein-interacting protein 3-like n=1 Tax=Tubulanus polymorphus TaxID=672921 RepID=UPI003DA63DD2